MMFDKNSKEQKKKRIPGDARDPKINSRGLLIFLTVLIAATVLIQVNHWGQNRAEELSYKQFVQKLEAKQIQSGEIIYYGQERMPEVRGEYLKTDLKGEPVKDEKGHDVLVRFRLDMPAEDIQAKQLLDTGIFKPRPASTVWANIQIGRAHV